MVNVTGGTSLEKAKQFVDFLIKYSGAQVYHCSHAIGEDVEAGEIKVGKYAYIGRYARLYFRRNDGKRREITIPAPLDVVFDNQEVRLTVGEEAVEAYANLTGESITFLHGGLIGNELPFA